MALPFFVNTFGGNPLDRRSDLRLEAAWLEARRSDPATVLVAMWNGQPLVKARDGGLELVRLQAPFGFTLAGSEENLLFLGTDADAAVFALELDGEADPSQGPL